jgi:UDP-N-acetylmuramate: L-alanyl-gamma-D-glutamyl-meso-diaminopimelate ligase
MKDQIGPSLVDADRVFCYTANLGWDAESALRPLGAKAVCEGDFDKLLQEIAASVRTGDHILVMSNGGFNGIHEKLLSVLSSKE